MLPLERWLLGEMLRSLGNPSVALVAWDGQSVTCQGGGQPLIRLHLRDPGALMRLVLDPEFQFGELYSCGRIEVEGDLVALIESINAAQWLRRGVRSRLMSCVHPPRSNLLSKSPGNIHHHYDIGNDFYRLWLDEQLLYTCAYFRAPSVGLKQAQVDKMDHVCRKHRLQPGEILVTITTAPPWTPLFLTAAGLVTDAGGLLSHGAVVAREYGIPAVVGTGCATRQIQDGQWLEVNGDEGIVRFLEEEK